MFYFARCINITFNSLLAQLVKYDFHTTHEIKFIHAIIYHIILLSASVCRQQVRSHSIITRSVLEIFVCTKLRR